VIHLRTAVVTKLEQLMEKDGSIVLITGDLGFSVLDGIRDRFPERFFNAGISEQAMMGIAAGLASRGKKVVVYSIIPFLIYRPYEQIMNDVCYHNLPVILVGSAEGFSYGNDAISHYALNDLSLTLQIQNMDVYAPAEPEEASAYLEEAISNGKPAYIRLSKAKNEHFTIKKEPHDGYLAFSPKSAGMVITTGSIGMIVERAVSRLGRNSFGHVHVGRLKPFPSELAEMLDRYETLIAIEEHEQTLGFGRYLSNFCRRHVDSIGVTNPFERKFGDRNFMLRTKGLDEEGIYIRIRELFKRD